LCDRGNLFGLRVCRQARVLERPRHVLGRDHVDAAGGDGLGHLSRHHGRGLGFRTFGHGRPTAPACIEGHDRDGRDACAHLLEAGEGLRLHDLRAAAEADEEHDERD
jgi:hypothetical protein